MPRMSMSLTLAAGLAAMAWSCSSVATVASTGSPAVAAQGPVTAPPAGFTALFNGRDLTGWLGATPRDPRQYDDMAPETEDTRRQAEQAALEANWRVVNGELVHNGAGPAAATVERYGDVELRLEYQVSPKPAATIVGPGSPAAPAAVVYLRGTPLTQWGAAMAKAARPAGQWNALRIVQLGERTTIHLNDRLIADHERMTNSWAPSLPIVRAGRIQLEGKSADVRWRRVFVRPIPGEEANRLLAAKNATGFTPLFNGKDLTGWVGAVESYQVIDGAIVCKPKQGGVLHTEKMYGDFVVRLEFKLPPGGNNGLAIRYPGKGDTAYVGMAELQVLDDTAAQYAKLDPRQYHGSVYGMAPAHRGYQRPVGEWNFQEVSVQGSRITVELNGTVIVAADVSTITQFAGKRAHPGKDRTEGFFGFAGHSDPVQFRNVAIRDIGDR
jgi:hypothetical protein